MVKSKLPPRSGSSLEAIELHQQKGAVKFFCQIRLILFSNTFFCPVKIHPVEKGVQQQLFLKILLLNFGIKLLKNTCKINYKAFFDGEKPYKL